MPANPSNAHVLRHGGTARLSRVIVPTTPSIEAQCRAVVARLEQLTGREVENDGNHPGPDARAIEALPDRTGWRGRAIIPWGHPAAGGEVSRDVLPVRAGRTGWYLQYDGVLYDTVRDAFAASRLSKPVSTPWSTTRYGHECRCITVAGRRVVIDGTVDIEAQLELMRKTLRHIAFAAPDINIDLIADDIFAGQRVLAEHYLLGLEADGFVDHAHEERQTSLMLTAEGCSSLLMLELTRHGANEDVMSPRTLAEAADAAEEPAPLSQRQIRALRTVQDIPRFLSKTHSHR
jgi:hypothetical protein